MQINLLTKLPSRVWIECDDAIPGYFQFIEYDRLPKCCKHCMRLGHDVHTCKIAHPSQPHVTQVTKSTRKKMNTG